MEKIALAATLVGYLIAAAGFVSSIAFASGRLRRWALGAAWVSLVPHALAIAERWREVGHGPFSSRYEVLSANGFLLVLIFLVAARMARPVRALGVFVMPVALVLVGWGLTAFGVREEVPIIFRSYWLWLHIGFAKLYGGSTLMAGACAAAFLLRSRRGGSSRWLPESEQLELYAHQFLLVAFLFLGAMIVAGSLWAHQSWGRYWAWDPIETSALGTWIANGVILHFRILHGWKGARMAWLTLLAVALMAATLYVVVLVTPTIHDFYMVGGR